ncbi:MAG: hypothetical protein JO247_09515 [Chloroflexi bacterium]|nr:hypothetical protein [Chloroflexota bacterium]
MSSNTFPEKPRRVPVSAGKHDMPVAPKLEPAGKHSEDVVAEASDESFPASDPPAWTSTNGVSRKS